MKTDLKPRLLEALKNSLGNVSSACRNVGISRQTYYEWLETDPSFSQEVDDINEGNIDFAETKLIEQISESNITAIIFYLKTKGKKRGYVERSEFDVNASHSVKKIDLSGLSEDELASVVDVLHKATSQNEEGRV